MTDKNSSPINMLSVILGGDAVVRPQLELDTDKDIAWWESLSYDWKIAIVYNHNYNYQRLGLSIIRNFDVIINDIDNGKRTEKKAFLAECKGITNFICSFYEGHRIQDLSPIHFLENIEKLYCKYIEVKNIQTIGCLTKLRLVQLHQTNLTSLLVFESLTQLEHLNVEGTKITNLQGIEKLHKLEFIDFNNTNVTSLEPLRNLSNVRHIKCFNTGIYDLEPIRELKMLKDFHCFSNRVDSIAVLADFFHLENVNFSRTNITDLLPLKNSVNLKQIRIKGTAISQDNLQSIKSFLPLVSVVT